MAKTGATESGATKPGETKAGTTRSRGTKVDETKAAETKVDETKAGKSGLEGVAPDPETLAHELIPSAPPPPAPPRRVGVRRVAGYDTSERLLSRRAFRPSGNSRRFWSRVEDDDPFLPAPPRHRTDDESATVAASVPSHDLYPSERLSRTNKAKPRSQSSSSSSPYAKKPSRQPSHTPDTGTARPPRPPRNAASKPPPSAQRAPQPQPQPRPAQAAPQPRPAPKPAPQAPASGRPPVDRRPPLIRNAHQEDRAAEAAEPSSTVRHRLVDASGRTSNEVRAERAAARQSGGDNMPPARGYDEIMAMMSELAASEALYHQGLLEDASEEETAISDPAPPPRPAARPAPRPAPEPEPEPAPAQRAPSVNRSPSGGNPGLDDLFGGNEGRVKIGKRTIPRPKPDE